jgi:DNA-binding Lrp family transcriptional regulator
MTGTVDTPRTAVSDDWWDELDAPVLEYVARHGEASPDEIARAVGLSPGSVGSILAMLAESGKVRITRVEAAARMRRVA